MTFFVSPQRSRPSVMAALSKRRSLVTVSTWKNAAPSATVRPGVVVEPMHAGSVFTALDQTKVGGGR